jgi:hypothetical protein
MLHRHPEGVSYRTVRRALKRCGASPRDGRLADITGFCLLPLDLRWLRLPLRLLQTFRLMPLLTEIIRLRRPLGCQDFHPLSLASPVLLYRQLLRRSLGGQNTCQRL